LAAVAAGTLSSPAWADAPRPLSDSLTGSAKASYEGGKLLFDDHDYAGAATKYRAAYDTSRDPRLLWNIAACEKELRHYARASILVDRFLAQAGAMVTPDFVAQAKATQAALREFFSPVRVTVTPDGALVKIDGEDVGRSPFANPVPVDLGKHVVHVEKEGFAPYEGPVDVAGQNAVSINVALKGVEAGPTTAILAVSASEERDVVTVDDQVVGSGKWEGTVPPGIHHVRVTAEGKQPYTAEIELHAGEHRSIETTLEDAGKKAPLWPWLVGGGAVLVAGAVVGGYFLFKPSNTEGPPPQGALGTIFISGMRVGPIR
jgi:hypothetical protein